MTAKKAKLWAAGVVALLVIIFLAQNSDSVELQILFWRARASQLVVFPAAMAFGGAIGFLVGRYWRR